MLWEWHLQGLDVMGVGDDVEVEVLEERMPRVARIEALWSERPVDGTERMLARCRFYYRPSVRPASSHGLPASALCSRNPFKCMTCIATVDTMTMPCSIAFSYTNFDAWKARSK